MNKRYPIKKNPNLSKFEDFLLSEMSDNESPMVVGTLTNPLYNDKEKYFTMNADLKNMIRLNFNQSKIFSIENELYNFLINRKRQNNLCLKNKGNSMQVLWCCDKSFRLST